MFRQWEFIPSEGNKMAKGLVLGAGLIASAGVPNNDDLLTAKYQHNPPELTHDQNQSKYIREHQYNSRIHKAKKQEERTKRKAKKQEERTKKAEKAEKHKRNEQERQNKKSMRNENDLLLALGLSGGGLVYAKDKFDEYIYKHKKRTRKEKQRQRNNRQHRPRSVGRRRRKKK